MDDRPDLGAMMAPVYRALLALEAPILAEHGLSMWEYVVLNRLADAPVRGQGELARRINADKTRLIEVLEALQSRGLIGREPDPGDRRTRLLTITAAGRRTRERVRKQIRAAEERLIADLAPGDRVGLLNGLHQLAERVRREEGGDA